MNRLFRTSTDILSLSYIGLSLVGLVILTVSIFTFKASTTNFNLQKQFFGSIFATICLLGIIIGVFPSRCSRILQFRKKFDKKEQTDQKTTTIGFIGHHPTCGNFSRHILQLKGKTYCAGCTGLVLGAMISLLGILTYSFLDCDVEGNVMLVFWVGFIAVVCGLLQHRIPDGNRGLVHFFLNVTFVLGAFLLLVGVNEITNNFLLDVYLLALIAYWILTRIMISQLEHRKICTTCLQFCSYSKKKLAFTSESIKNTRNNKNTDQYHH